MWTKSRHKLSHEFFTAPTLSLPQLCGVVVRTRPKKKLWRKNFVPAVQLATPRDFTTGSPPALVSCYARANQVPRSSSSPSAKTEAIHADCPGLEQVAPQSVARSQGHVPPLVPSTQLCPIRPHPLKARSFVPRPLLQRREHKGSPDAPGTKKLGTADLRLGSRG